MNIQHEEASQGGRFYLENDGAEHGEITYVKRDGQIVIQHTGVDAEYQGKGYGEKLVQEVVSYAKESDFKIKPVCSFAREILESDPKYKEILA